MSTVNPSAAYQKKALPGAASSFGWVALILGVVLAGAGYAMDPLRSQFVSIMLFMFVAGVAICPLFMVAIEYLAGVVWSTPIRRVFELMSYLVWLLPIFALPVLFNMGSIYEWTYLQNDPILMRKAPYLNQTFFVIRFFVIWIVWVIFQQLFVRRSLKQDETKDQGLTSKNIKMSALFIPVFGLSITVLSIDFMMSLEPHWFSTIFGVNFFIGSLVAALAVATIATILLNESGYLGKGIVSDHYYNLGFGMFAGCIFWTYTAFSQGMLIWYANLPEETPWFLHRWQNGWSTITYFLLFVHFIVPLFGLIQRKNKRNVSRMLFMSMWVIFAHMVDLYWIVMPTYGHNPNAHSHGPTIGITELGAVAIAAGVITLVFSMSAKNKNLIPVGDPKLQRGLNFRL